MKRGAFLTTSPGETDLTTLLLSALSQGLPEDPVGKTMLKTTTKITKFVERHSLQ